MRDLKAIKEQIKLTKQIINSEDFYDDEDKWGNFGYLHGLLFAKGELRGKN